MSRQNFNQQVSARQFIPDGIYPALNDARFTLLHLVSGANDFLGALNQMHLLPFIVTQTVKVKGISCTCNTAGGGSAVVRMGIYGALDNGAPGSLIVDGGTVSVTSTGVKSVVISEMLLPGKYYGALVPQDWTTTQPNFRGLLDGTRNINVPVMPVDGGFTGGFSSIMITGVSGALPATAGAIANSTAGRRTPDMNLQIEV
jgi:hypothetical protein